VAERELTASVVSAIAAGVIRPVLFAELEYESAGVPAFLCLFTGVGQLSWNGQTWIGGLTFSRFHRSESPPTWGRLAYR
jgi:hypothetical protein